MVEVRTALALAPVLVAGIKDMFVRAGLDGWSEAFAAFEAQCAAYGAFVERELLPRARSDHRLPPPVYADAMRRVGIDIPPAELTAQAHAAFDSTVAEMQALAPGVAAELGIDSHDYRDCIAALKQTQIRGDAQAIEAFYRARLDEIEAIVRRERLVTLPNVRPAFASPR